MCLQTQNCLCKNRKRVSNFPFNKQEVESKTQTQYIRKPDSTDGEENSPKTVRDFKTLKLLKKNFYMIEYKFKKG